MSEEKIILSFAKACLIDLYKTEKMIAVRNQRIAEFQLHWSTFEKLFENFLTYFVFLCKFPFHRDTIKY